VKCLPPGQARPELQGLRQLGRKCASGLLVAVPAAAFTANVAAIGIGACGRRLLSAAGCIFALRGLRRVGSQHAIFKRRSIEAADDRLHLFVGGCFDESEAFGFLRFVVTDHFDGIGHEVFGGQPLLNVVGGDPGREIAKKYGEAHSVDV
jgi:hypothetical protein